ncbi:ribosome biogenesis protein-like protein Brx1 [Aureobasidium pullulans]|uniref:Ribosome biogenesis protein-like protein Brx1 n=2 Tax=Aureobasidium pullulans TaxID=5580 RepID=A0A074XZY1_AURPU|nr:ribosome biogenesis protein-like protein Brx1 [Aureobasidium pullulans EXF-150]THV72935.1 ribosome biogenesis protein-like protein Brx1 [Aureobasidium pullulans]KEQ80196.1 ribosome biogenesis protein-like protein Brx1 [Aureobasidium pullulans EXF-150]THV93620.1 ribosome biogenesis protein-like protein Brx1 [Aureobasidium pullulans]THV99567.1 ribosome biogenesis protein-like protein Brx1 [Aureobasidium pullulans]THW12688.1 ribosome biogenesis protein-like protein Brx1 [Aureobasidium pullulan
MASVYKSLSKSENSGSKEDALSTGPKNRQRVLILSSRGITYRHRHLLNDLYSLLPHSRKDAKLDTKTKLYQLNELADLYNCNNVFFFEARKGKDLYIWMSKPPNGPTVKFHLQNLHTMEELHFTGNCLKGSRPVLSFDATFDSAPHLKLIKELLTQTFGVPKGARKTKPFVDHVMAFTVADNKVWTRVYQINETEAGKTSAIPEQGLPMPSATEVTSAKGKKDSETKLNLVEIGPRFVLTPIIIQEGSFGGPIIYENKEFVSPNQVRREVRVARSAKYNNRAEAVIERKAKKGDLGLTTSGGKTKEVDELDEKMLFA